MVHLKFLSQTEVEAIFDPVAHAVNDESTISAARAIWWRSGLPPILMKAAKLRPFSSPTGTK